MWKNLLSTTPKLLRQLIQHRPYSSESAVKVTFKTRTGDIAATGQLGESLLDVVINNDLPLDGFGACEGTVACCTCHVILNPEHFNRLAEASEEEMDMLDLAPALDDYSRLGCQVVLTKADKPEITVVVPDETRDARTL
ncbi:unnamed protein product [Bursaphelenchus okinawaensis]|uniref:2Fe-2S ferredoxin-type domain-containing protein n=1 Tax=Bursaphelenchus okinawaensis TaxID=465554 RepID=A0A811LI55_9BILA|nr:unnamed protein product [Bursaphelenchus okinawaensis]CAG9124215.1 unnamed protein product [Bursaphelenchus okinawaensis]